MERRTQLHVTQPVAGVRVLVDDDTAVEAAARQELAARVVAAAVDVRARNLRDDSPGRLARAWCREAENTRDPLRSLL